MSKHCFIENISGQSEALELNAGGVKKNITTCSASAVSYFFGVRSTLFQSTPKNQLYIDHRSNRLLPIFFFTPNIRNNIMNKFALHVKLMPTTNLW
ncbi:MAG: hypothetical protein SCK70_00705 [bacterium]|nr:hypothetical protein [bacterium]